MHSLLQRLNHIFAMAVSACTAVIMVVSVLTLLVLTRLPTTDSALRVRVDDMELSMGAFDYPFFDKSRKEFLFVDATINADLTPLFHWNTKELFLYLTMEYAGKKHNHNEIVLWDRIILEDREEALLTNLRVQNKYPVNDVEQSLRNKNVTVTLKWDVIPYFGAITRMEMPESGKARLVLPAKHTAHQESKK